MQKVYRENAMSKLNLLELQETMQNFLLSKDIDGHCDSSIVAPANGDTAAARLHIYKNTYHLTMRESLAENFFALHRMLGEKRFNMLADAYIAAKPSTFFSLGDYGVGLEAFMRTHPDYRQHLALIEMAQFEWALNNSIFAAPGQVLKREDLTSISPESFGELCFNFHPSFQLLELRTNVPLLWKAANQDEPLPSVETREYAVLWCVWRKMPEVYFAHYESQEAEVVKALFAGKSFAKACEVLARSISEEEAAEAPNLIGLLLQRLIAEEQLSGFH